MKSTAIKHFFQRYVVDGWRERHGGRVRRAGYLVGISTMLPAARAMAAVAPGDREVFPWTPVIMALHTSMQGQGSALADDRRAHGQRRFDAPDQARYGGAQAVGAALGRCGGVGDV